MWWTEAAEFGARRSRSMAGAADGTAEAEDARTVGGRAGSRRFSSARVCGLITGEGTALARIERLISRVRMIQWSEG